MSNKLSKKKKQIKSVFFRLIALFKKQKQACDIKPHLKILNFHLFTD